MALFSSVTNLFSSKPKQQQGYVNGQPIASFYTPPVSTAQPKPLASTMPLTAPAAPKPIISAAPKPVAPLPTAAPVSSTLSSADLLNNTRNAYQSSGLVSANQFTNPAPAATPEAPKIDYTSLQKTIENITANLSPSQEETNAQNDLNNIINSRDLGIAEYRNRPVPMGIITGQTQALTEQAATKSQPLKDKLALEQARRQASLDASKFQYQAEEDRINREVEQQNLQQQYQQEQSKPIEVNGQLVERQPDGSFKSVFGAPKAQSISDQYGSGTIGEYNFYVAQEQAAGRKPMSFNEYQTMDANRKKSITNVNVGGSGMSAGQITAFNNIVSQYNKSPLVQAADRTPVLSATIDQVRKDPGNAAQQLNLAYAYIQALDTYQSAVREGELGLVNSIDSKVGQLQNAVQQIQNGQIVRSDVALQIANAASNIVDTIKSAAAQKAKSYQAQASTVGLGSQWDQYTGGFTPSYTTTPSNPTAELDSAIAKRASVIGTPGSPYKTREDLIRALQTAYPQLKDSIPSKVYQLIPDRK